MNCLNHRVLQIALLDGRCVTRCRAMLHASAAPPDNGVLATVVPGNPAVDLTAHRTVNDARQFVLATVYPLFPLRSAMEVCPSHHLLLHLHIKVAWNNRLMAAFHIVLWDNAVVLDSLFREEIHCIGFLQKGITDVLLVLQDLPQCFRTPFRFSCRRQDFIRLKPSSCLEQTTALQVFPVDALHNLRLSRLNNQMPILVFCVSEETIVVDLTLAVLVIIIFHKSFSFLHYTFLENIIYYTH